MMLHLAMAMGRIVLTGRDVTRMLGMGERVLELDDVLTDLNEG